MDTRGGAPPRPDAGSDPDGQPAAAAPAERDADPESPDAAADAQRDDPARSGVRYEPL